VLFISELFANPAFYVTWVIVVAFSICVHEYCHAYVALCEGDDTAFRSGHLSMNPLVVMGHKSLIMLAIVGLAWGAVPVNRSKFRHRYGAALVSFAGPGANLVLAVVFAFLSALVVRFVGAGPVKESYGDMLRVGCWANSALFILNMLPIPLLDGWDVYSYIIPPMRRAGRLFHGETAWAVVILLVFAGFRYLWSAAAWLSFAISGIVNWLVL